MDKPVLRGELEQLLNELHVPDALMLRRVKRLRDLAREVDRELAALERHFTGTATPPGDGDDNDDTLT